MNFDQEIIKTWFLWFGLVATLMLLGIAIFKRLRWTIVMLFGVVLINAGAVADRYGFGSFIFTIGGLFLSCFGAYLALKNRNNATS